MFVLCSIRCFIYVYLDSKSIFLWVWISLVLFIENSFHKFSIELFSSSSSSPSSYYYYSAPKSRLWSFDSMPSLIYGLNILIFFPLSLTERYNPPLCLRSLSWRLPFLFYNGASYWAFHLTYWIFPCPLCLPSVFLCLYWIPLFFAVLNALFHSAMCSLESHWSLLASLISRYSYHLDWTLSGVSPKSFIDDHCYECGNFWRRLTLIFRAVCILHWDSHIWS